MVITGGHLKSTFCQASQSDWEMVCCYYIKSENRTLQNDSFLICGQLMRQPLIELFHLCNCFKCQMTVEWSTLSSLATSCGVLRGPALMIFSIGYCQLPMASHYVKALVSFAKLLEPPLHCMFFGSSWAKSVVDVASCLCCYTTHFELE